MDGGQDLGDVVSFEIGENGHHRVVLKRFNGEIEYSGWGHYQTIVQVSGYYHATEYWLGVLPTQKIFRIREIN